MNNMPDIRVIVREASRTKDMDIIKKFLSEDNYPNISKDEKEKEIFIQTITCMMMFKIPQDILYYLVWDYKISEANSINNINIGEPETQQAERMFAKRKAMLDFHTELTGELNKNLEDSNKPNKKLKV